MAITRETVLHVARLARLDLAEDEVELMQRDMSNILQYIATLSELDTSEVPETSQVAEEGAPMRADQVRPGVPTEQALAQAPRVAEGSFAVPGFVDE